MMSDGDAHIKGPIARPRAGIATVQFICDRVTLYFSWSEGKDGTVVVVMYVNMKYLDIVNQIDKDNR